MSFNPSFNFWNPGYAGNSQDRHFYNYSSKNLVEVQANKSNKTELLPTVEYNSRRSVL